MQGSPSSVSVKSEMKKALDLSMRELGKKRKRVEKASGNGRKGESLKRAAESTTLAKCNAVLHPDDLFKKAAPSIPLKMPSKVTSILERHGLRKGRLMDKERQLVIPCSPSRKSRGLKGQSPRIRELRKTSSTSSKNKSNNNNDDDNNDDGKSCTNTTTDQKSHGEGRFKFLRANSKKFSSLYRVKRKQEKNVKKEREEEEDPEKQQVKYPGEEDWPEFLFPEEDDSDFDSDDSTVDTETREARFKIKTALAGVQRSTLEKEIKRLTHENVQFVKQLASLELMTKERESTLEELTHLNNHEEHMFCTIIEDAHALTKAFKAKCGSARSYQLLILNELDRYKQLKFMHFRTMDQRNVLKQRTDALIALFNSDHKQGEEYQKRQELRVVRKEIERLQTTITRLCRSNEAAHKAFEDQFSLRLIQLDETQKLRKLQEETVARRQEIILKAKGDLSKKQEKKLRITNAVTERRKSLVSDALKDLHTSVSHYQSLIKRLQQITGMEEGDDVAAVYFDREHRRMQLEQEVGLAEKIAEDLRQRYEESSKKLRHLREFGYETSEKVADFATLDNRLSEARTIMHGRFSRCRGTVRIIASLMESMIPIGQQLWVAVPKELSATPTMEQFGDAHFVADYSKHLKLFFAQMHENVVQLICSFSSAGKAASDEAPSDAVAGAAIELGGAEKALGMASFRGGGYNLSFGASAHKSLRAKRKSAELRRISGVQMVTFENIQLSKPPCAILNTEDVPLSPLNVRVKLASSPVASSAKQADTIGFVMAADDASCASEESVAESDKDIPNCFDFLDEGFNHDSDALAEIVARRAKIEAKADKGDTEPVHGRVFEHNRRLFHIIGEGRLDHLHPEAISAKELYTRYIRENGLKQTCFSRQDAKMLSEHLLTQEKQSQEFSSKQNKPLDLERRQSKLIKMRRDSKRQSFVDNDLISNLQSRRRSTKQLLVGAPKSPPKKGKSKQFAPTKRKASIKVREGKGKSKGSIKSLGNSQYLGFVE